MRFVLVCLLTSVFSSLLNAQVIEKDNWPIRSDALIRGEAEQIPIVDLLRTAVGDDAWVIFADDRDQTIAVSFEGPRWATQVIDEALLEAGLKAIWIGETLVVYGDAKPYIVGHTPRSLRSKSITSYIVPAGTAVNVFSQVAAEWGRQPMIDTPLEQTNWRFAYALKFQGLSLDDDLAELRVLIDQLTDKQFAVSTRHHKQAAVLTLNQKGQPRDLLPELTECYQSQSENKSYREIQQDMEECRSRGVWVRNKLTSKKN